MITRLTEPLDVRVLIVEKHELVRDQVAARIVSHSSLTLVGTANSANQAIERARHLTPDVVVIDGALFGQAALSLCRQVHEVNSSSRCIVYTAVQIDEARAFAAGIAAVVLKQLRHDTLLDVIISTPRHID